MENDYVGLSQYVDISVIMTVYALKVSFRIQEGDGLQGRRFIA
jgi:hypothetical protein